MASHTVKNEVITAELLSERALIGSRKTEEVLGRDIGA